MLVIAAPIFILLISIAAYLFYRARNNLGMAWAMDVIASILAFGLIIFLRFRLPTELVVKDWQGFTGHAANILRFQADYTSWPFAMMLMAVTLAFILTAPARLGQLSNPVIWTRTLVMVSFGLFAVFAQSPLAVVLAWAGLDVVEFVLLQSSLESERLRSQVVLSFGIRVGGTIALVSAMVISQASGLPLEFESIQPNASLLVLLGIGLRLGILPLNLPFTDEMVLRRGFGTVLRIIQASTCLVVLARLPEQLFSPVWTSILLSITFLAMIYAASMWLVSSDELKGRPFFMIVVGGFGITCVLLGHPAFVGIWTTALLISGGILFLSSARGIIWLVLIGMAMVGMTGLPYTPAAPAWLGLIPAGFNLTAISSIIVLILLVLGYFKHTLRKRDEVPASDPVARTLYPLGLALLIVIQWGLGIFGGPGYWGVGVWWASVAVSFACLVVGGVWFFWGKNGRVLQPNSWIVMVGGRVGLILSSILSLGWIFVVLKWFYALFSRFVQFLTEVLEGDGGVLWVLVLLALLVTLIQGSVLP